MYSCFRSKFPEHVLYCLPSQSIIRLPSSHKQCRIVIVSTLQIFLKMINTTFCKIQTLINAYMGTGLQRDYVLNRMSTYIFFMSFVGNGSIVSTFFAVITTGDNASKTGKILWVGNSAENYVSLTDGVTLHIHITSSIWMQCALAKV